MKVLFMPIPRRKFTKRKAPPLRGHVNFRLKQSLPPSNMHVYFSANLPTWEGRVRQVGIAGSTQHLLQCSREVAYGNTLTYRPSYIGSPKGAGDCSRGGIRASRLVSAAT